MRSAFEVILHEPIDQRDAVAGGALVVEVAGLVGPDHAGDVEMGPFDALLDEPLEEGRGGDRAAFVGRGAGWGGVWGSAGCWVPGVAGMTVGRHEIRLRSYPSRTYRSARGRSRWRACRRGGRPCWPRPCRRCRDGPI